MLISFAGELLDLLAAPGVKVFFGDDDNNGIENATRPTAVGKKNWLFVSGEETDDRSAVIYTLIERAKRHGVSAGCKRCH